MENIFPTAYFPPLSYIRQIVSCVQSGLPIFIEQHESYKKQTFRNRCVLYDCHDKRVQLTIPIVTYNHQLTKDVKIAYYQPWERQHWHTLLTLYNSTPYFLYYSDFLYPFFHKKYTWLIDFNENLLYTLLSLLYNNNSDMRYSIKRTSSWLSIQWTDKHSWQDEISILPYLFENGPQTLYML